MNSSSLSSLSTCRSLWRILSVFAVSLLLFCSCAAPNAPVYHGLEFDARYDSPGIDVLAYQYGGSSVHGTKYPEYKSEEGRPVPYGGTDAEMSRGDFLYVKWRIRKTGEVFEDTVDLRHALPGEIEKSRIYFIAKERQLYVFFIPTLRGAVVPYSNPIEKYWDRKVVQLYPKTEMKVALPGGRQ